MWSKWILKRRLRRILAGKPISGAAALREWLHAKGYTISAGKKRTSRVTTGGVIRTISTATPSRPPSSGKGTRTRTGTSDSTRPPPKSRSSS